MDLPKNLKDEIWDYCRVNNISNIDEFTIKLVRQGFTVEKFGATPSTKVIEKEVDRIVEVIKEVKVEVIKEIPVEKIVEKEVYITDNTQTKELADKVVELEKELSLTNKNYLDDVDVLTKKETMMAKEYNELHDELEVIKKLLTEEQNKNKRDIYGEN